MRCAGSLLVLLIVNDNHQSLCTGTGYLPVEAHGLLFVGRKVAGFCPDCRMSRFLYGKVCTVLPRCPSRFRNHGVCDVSLSFSFSCILSSQVSCLWSPLWYQRIQSYCVLFLNATVGFQKLIGGKYCGCGRRQRAAGVIRENA